MQQDSLSVTECLAEISQRLGEAAAIAKGAVACAEAGAPGQAVRMAMDLDEILHEVTALHGTMRLLHRRTRPPTG